MCPKPKSHKPHIGKLRGKSKISSPRKRTSRAKTRRRLAFRKAPKARVSRFRRAFKKSQKAVDQINRRFYPVPGAPRYD